MLALSILKVSGQGKVIMTMDYYTRTAPITHEIQHESKLNAIECIFDFSQSKVFIKDNRQRVYVFYELTESEESEGRSSSTYKAYDKNIVDCYIILDVNANYTPANVGVFVIYSNYTELWTGTLQQIIQ